MSARDPQAIAVENSFLSISDRVRIIGPKDETQIRAFLDGPQIFWTQLFPVEGGFVPYEGPTVRAASDLRDWEWYAAGIRARLVEASLGKPR